MDIINAVLPFAAALLPTIGVAFLFYWVVRYMIEADRRERKALASWNAAQERERASAKGAGDNDESPNTSDTSY